MFAFCATISANRFVAPITFVGLTALSVEISKTCDTEVSLVALHMDLDVKEVVLTEVGTRDGFQSEKKNNKYGRQNYAHQRTSKSWF